MSDVVNSAASGSDGDGGGNDAGDSDVDGSDVVNSDAGDSDTGGNCDEICRDGYRRQTTHIFTYQHTSSAKLLTMKTSNKFTTLKRVTQEVSRPRVAVRPVRKHTWKYKIVIK